jgi:hypothetical protein
MAENVGENPTSTTECQCADPNSYNFDRLESRLSTLDCLSLQLVLRPDRAVWVSLSIPWLLLECWKAKRSDKPLRS